MGIHVYQEHDHAAGGIVFCRRKDKQLFLVIKDPFGKYAFPKGHPEKGENDQKAAIREIFEETGVAVSRPSADLGLQEYAFADNGRTVFKSVRFFLFEVSDPITPLPALSEGIKEARWVDSLTVTSLLDYRETNLPVLEKALKITGKKVPASKISYGN